MASQNATGDYESTLKILSVLECSKPTALVTISQTTGIKLADIIRFCTLLVKANVIQRDVDSGTIYYTLLSDEYEAKVADIFDVAPRQDESIIDKRPRDSREAIMLRRAMRLRDPRKSRTRKRKTRTSQKDTRTTQRLRSLRHEAFYSGLLALSRFVPIVSTTPIPPLLDDESRSIERRQPTILAVVDDAQSRLYQQTFDSTKRYSVFV